MLDLVLKVTSWVLTGLAMGVAGNLITPGVGRELRKRRRRVLASWRELQLNALARRINQLRRIAANPTIAIADMVMALFVSVVGGFYALAILGAVTYVRVAHPAERPDVVPFLGGVALIWAGLYRAIDAYGDLTENSRKISKLKARGLRRRWEVEDACAALLDDRTGNRKGS